MYEGNQETSLVWNSNVSVPSELQARVCSVGLDVQILDAQILVEQLSLNVFCQTVRGIFFSLDLAVLQDLLYLLAATGP